MNLDNKDNVIDEIIHFHHYFSIYILSFPVSTKNSSFFVQRYLVSLSPGYIHFKLLPFVPFTLPSTIVTHQMSFSSFRSSSTIVHQMQIRWQTIWGAILNAIIAVINHLLCAVVDIHLGIASCALRTISRCQIERAATIVLKNNWWMIWASAAISLMMGVRWWIWAAFHRYE